jgi:hypothetical protein
MAATVQANIGQEIQRSSKHRKGANRAQAAQRLVYLAFAVKTPKINAPQTSPKARALSRTIRRAAV